MRIIGPDELVFGVDDLTACRQFLIDYGLDEQAWDEAGGTFVALDNTAARLRARGDVCLSQCLSALRLCLYGMEKERIHKW